MKENINHKFIKNSIFLALVIMVACSGKTPVKTPLISISETPLVEPSMIEEPSCQTIKVAPTPGSIEESIFPDMIENDHVRGPSSAEITIIEYGDFQCPGCANLSPVLIQLEKKYSNELKVVFRQLPLFDIHDKALIAAQASEAASDFGKFWEMHDLLFNNYEIWKLMLPEQFIQWLLESSSSIGINASDFEKSLYSQSIKDRVQLELENALRIGLRTTPFLLINGQIYSGPRDFNSLDQIISLIALGKRQFLSCPEFTIDTIKQYLAILHTEKGDITIQLFADKAPIAVNSFIFLANNHWYDNNTFFRAIPGSMVQTGDPSGTGFGGPGFLFQNEISSSLAFDHPGVVAMANNGSDTNGSQFFITLEIRMDLNGNYTIFGQVIEGMEVLEKITPRDPGAQINLPPGDILVNISIVEK